MPLSSLVVAALLVLPRLAAPAPGAVAVPVPASIGTSARAPSGSGADWPLAPRPRVVRGFQPPATRWGPGHRGVDLLGRAVQTVFAARAGRISFAGRLAGRGVVVVDHGATRTSYEPVHPSVRVGDRVAQGTPIGTLQHGASHCFPRACLHWGWLRGRTYLDPLILVGGGPVRLLPLGSTAAGPAGSALPFAGPFAGPLVTGPAVSGTGRWDPGGAGAAGASRLGARAGARVGVP